jgi:hypothetical protein
MTDFRALCAALIDEAPYESPTTCMARAALAQPEPQGPTDEELWDLYQDLGSYFSPTEFARTVLTRWGRPAIEPVPQGPSETAWALAQLLDGVQRHDLPNMTGLSDSDCDRIWAARWGNQ